MTDFTLTHQLETEAAIALQFQEELESLDFAEALPESATPEELDRTAPSLIRFLLQSGDKGYKDVVDRLDPVPSQANNWLYDAEAEAFKGRFIDERPARDRVFEFTIKRTSDGWTRSFKAVSGDFEGEDD